MNVTMNIVESFCKFIFLLILELTISNPPVVKCLSLRVAGPIFIIKIASARRKLCKDANPSVCGA